MPGIAGFANIKTSDEFSSHLGNMLKCMTYRSDYVMSQHVLPKKNIALGKTVPAILGEKYDNLSEEITCFFDGELYAADAVQPTQLIKENAFERLNALDGSFAFTCFDGESNRLYLVTDRFGTKPIYFTSLANGFAFASEIKALLALPDLNKKIDIQSFADCFHFGFVLGNKTLFENIHLLPPGSILCYDLQQNTYDVTAYWHLTDAFLSVGNQADSANVDAVVESFGAAVSKRMGQIENLGVSLSGGLDSRAILAAMGGNAQGVHSYTLGLPNCQDQKLSDQLSHLAKTKHEFLEISPEHLGNFHELAETLINLSDGLYHPHESTEKRALDYFSSAPFRIVLRGHGGEIAKASLAYPVQVRDEVVGYKNVAQVNQFIFDSANLVARELPLSQLFSQDVLSDVTDGSRQSLEDGQKPAGERLSPADQCIYFYINQWIRRQVVASLAIFRTQQEIRLPFLDVEFLQRLLSLPLANRFAGEIQVDIVRKYFPSMLKIVNSNTGAPLNASKTREFLTEKLNSVFKKLSLPGFRHYTEFQQWQRDQFRSSIEAILFDPRTLDRGLYNADGVRSVVEAHTSGRSNYAHLLGTMTGLELWYRRFVD